MRLIDLRLATLGLGTGLALALSACSSAPKAVPAEPTLAQLPARSSDLPVTGQAQRMDDDSTAQAYEAYLRSGGTPQRQAQAQRRLGDLALERAEKSIETDPSATSDRAALRDAAAYYQRRLKATPDAPDNDAVWYQLARTYELLGNAEDALASLDALVSNFPGSALRDEVEFRRGEWLFALRRFAAAAAAYDVVVHRSGASAFGERALYMRGWCRYKQGLLDDAVEDFLGVLDDRIPVREPLAPEAVLTRADQELVDDTLRVISLSLASLQGAASIEPLLRVGGRQRHAFRLYSALADLYVSQERSKDAADALLAFVDGHAVQEQAPSAMVRVIGILAHAGLEQAELQTRRSFVDRFGPDGPMAHASGELWRGHARPELRTILLDLAHRDHARAQISHDAADRGLALREYEQWLACFSDDPQGPSIRFLRAELLFDDGQFAQAVEAYEQVAYTDSGSPNRAESGYAALLAYAALAREPAADAQALAVTRRSLDSAVRFASSFADDPRTPAVLLDAARRAYDAHELASARSLATRLIARRPPAEAGQRRRAWRIEGQAAFDLGDYADSEHAVKSELADGETAAADQALLNDRLALSIYRQAEAQRDQHHDQEAIGTFLRVGRDAAGSSISAPAQIDAAALLIACKDWAQARSVLLDFRERFAHHALQSGVAARLAVIDLELGDWKAAADEFDRVIAQGGDAEAIRTAQWQVAELRQKDGDADRAAAAYLRYVQGYPAPFEANIEARSRLLELQRKRTPARDAEVTARELLAVEAGGGASRSARTHLLGSEAALYLAQVRLEGFRAVALVEPLKAQLKLKKARMEDALAALVQASGFGVAQTMTQANFLAAELYREFGAAMLASERPHGLSPDELEQYDVLLEEQAFPFEEKAVAMHETNARLVREGLDDVWIRDSYAALARLRPVRFAKSEQAEEQIDVIR